MRSVVTDAVVAIFVSSLHWWRNSLDKPTEDNRLLHNTRKTRHCTVTCLWSVKGDDFYCRKTSGSKSKLNHVAQY